MPEASAAEPAQQRGDAADLAGCWWKTHLAQTCRSLVALKNAAEAGRVSNRFQSSPCPQPDIDCADCLALQRFQAFSITALVHEVSAPRLVDKENRVVRDVIICDGSKIPRRDADTLVEAIVKPTLQIFSGPGDAAMIDKLTAAAGKHVPLTFLGMQAKTT